MRWFPLVLALVLVGCETSQTPRIETQIVKVPTPAPCVPADLSAAPLYVDTDELLKLSQDAAERYLRLWDGRKQRIAREQELEAAVAACPRVLK